MNKQILKVFDNVKKIIIGRDEVIKNVLISILARGHILIEDILVLKNHVIIQKRINGLQQIEVKEIATGRSEYIHYPEETYSST